MILRFNESQYFFTAKDITDNMMNKINYREEDNLCRRIIIKFDR